MHTSEINIREIKVQANTFVYVTFIFNGIIKNLEYSLEKYFALSDNLALNESVINWSMQALKAE